MQSAINLVHRMSILLTSKQSGRMPTQYHKLKVEDVAEAFPDIDATREAIAASITKVWIACEDHPSVKIPILFLGSLPSN